MDEAVHKVLLLQHIMLDVLWDGVMAAHLIYSLFDIFTQYHCWTLLALPAASAFSRIRDSPPDSTHLYDDQTTDDAFHNIYIDMA